MTPGTGGPGRWSDISGTLQMYGAGGGAGTVYNNWNESGMGGDGIGGHGRRDNLGYWVGDEAGRTGFGGGGGGGADYAQNSINRRGGAPGGAGTVVVRFAIEPEDGLADAQVVSAEAGADPSTAVALVGVRSRGADANADVCVAYGLSRESLSLRTAPVAVSADGYLEIPVAGLVPGQTYYLAAAISNDVGEAVSRALEYTAPKALPAAGGAYGLWQARWGASATGTDDSIWSQVSVSNVVSGAIAAIGKGDATDPLTGETFMWGSAPFMFLYKGYFYAEAGRTYTFASRFDDSVYLELDGTNVVLQSQASPQSSGLGAWTPEWTGWHEIDIRLGNGYGALATHGPDGDDIDTWAAFGLAFNTKGTTTQMPETDWTQLMDPGDGSLLRPDDPGLRYSDLDKYVEAQNLTVTATVAPGDIPVHAYLCYGPAWGGNAPADWSQSADLGEVAAADAVTALASQSVAGWGTTAKVAAVALVHPDGTVTWSAPVSFAGTALMSIDACGVSDNTQGDMITVAYAVSGGSAPYTATLYAGPSPGALSPVATATHAAAGSYELTATGLTPESTVYWQLVLEDSAGISAQSSVGNVTLPGRAALSQNYSDYALAAVQNQFHYTGVLSTLGAGENWVYLMVYENAQKRWSDDNTYRDYTTNTLAAVKMDSAGGFAIDYEAPWGSRIAWNFGVSNSNGRITWIKEHEPQSIYNHGSKHYWASDNQTYLWNGGEGASDDASKWTPQGSFEHNAGYPIIGSYATFPAGTSVVNLPQGADKAVEYSNLTVPSGADVTIRGSATSAALNMTRIGPPLREGTPTVEANASLTLNGVRGLWSSSANYCGVVLSGASATTTNRLHVTGGSDLKMGWSASNNSGFNAWSDSSYADILIDGGSTFTVLGNINFAGHTRMAISNATVVMSPATDGGRVNLRLKSDGGIVFRGKSPVLRTSSYFLADKQSNPTGDTIQYLDFEIPVGGYDAPPIQTREGNTRAFAEGCNGAKIALRVPATSPAANADGTIDQKIVDWPLAGADGIADANLVLSSDNLPNPATDYFYVTKDGNGVDNGIAVHIEGRAAHATPVIDRFAVTAVSATSATVTFVANAGDAAGAGTLTLTSSITGGASVSLSPGSVTGAATVTATITGLSAGTAYTLTVDGENELHDAATATYAFRSYDGVGAASVSVPAGFDPATAYTVTTDGPYTVWTFLATNAPGEYYSFEVTRAGAADILAVGGGGAGGNYGGGGGG
ncbi:MAG: hypothetical protein II839_01010, partial [Kiritimatiellae bacterium]|nr:hypothetical protein [Kiritimatiellia bacterium]